MDIKGLVVRAYIWNIAGKMIIRSLGIISTLILVRLLNPDDFGLIAIATMVSGFFVILSATGMNRYLIVKPDISEDEFSAAWTLNICFRVVAIGLLLIVAPYIADYMGNQELTLVIRLMSIVELVSLFKNIGMVRFERKIDYGPENKLQITAKIISFIATISFALYFKNYYALVIGSFTNILVYTVGSYVVSNYRPRLDFRFKKEMFQFSGFLMLRNIIGYSRSQLDTLIVGRMFGDVSAGYFNVSRQFALLPQTEILSPAMQPALSAMSSLKSNRSQLYDKAYQALFLSFTIVIPAAFGLYFLADPFVDVVLGDKWDTTKDVINVLGFLMLPFACQPLLFIMYDACNKIQYSFLADVYGIAAIIVTFLVFTPSDVTLFADIRVLVGFSSLCVSLLLAKVFLQLSLRKVGLLIFIPLLCALIMYAVLVQIGLNVSNPLIQLLANSVIGALFYAFTYAAIAFVSYKHNKHSFLTRLYPEFILKKLIKSNYG